MASLKLNDKTTLATISQETTDWIGERVSSAGTGGLGWYGISFIKYIRAVYNSFADVQGVVNPITSKPYSTDTPRSSGDDDTLRSHDEL
jgi:endoplasmic reticulum chaperone BiP